MVLQTLFTTFHAQRLWRLLDAPVYGEVPGAPGVRGEINYRLLARRWHTQVRRGEQQHSLSFRVLNVWKACRKPTTANPCFEDI
jgi:hypothetical protein